MTLHLRCSFMITLCPCFSVGSLPWDAVLPKLILHGLFTGRSSSRTAPIWSIPQHLSVRSKLLQHGSPMGGSCPLTPCSCVGSSLKAAAPAGPLHGPQTPPGHIHLLHRGLLHGLQHGHLFHVGPLGCRGTACSTRGLSIVFRGTSLLVPRSPPALLLR